MKLEPINRAFEDWDALLSLILASFASMHPRIDPPSSALGLTLQSLKQKGRNRESLCRHRKWSARRLHLL